MLNIAQYLEYTKSFIMAAQTAILLCLQNTNSALSVGCVCKVEFTHEDAHWFITIPFLFMASDLFRRAKYKNVTLCRQRNSIKVVVCSVKYSGVRRILISTHKLHTGVDILFSVRRKFFKTPPNFSSHVRTYTGVKQYITIHAVYTSQR